MKAVLHGTFQNNRQFTDDTARLMRAYVENAKVKPFFYELRAKIFRKVPEKNLIADVWAIHEWLDENIRYTKDPLDIELVQHPQRLVELGLGDCDCISSLGATLLEIIGHESTFYTLSNEMGKPHHHVTVAAKIGPARIVIDPKEIDRPIIFGEYVKEKKIANWKEY